MTKREIITKANDNIMYLIDAIISRDESHMKNYCINEKAQRAGECSSCCGVCHKEYFEKKRQQLISAYCLNEDNKTVFRIKWHSKINKTSGYVLNNRDDDKLNSKVEFGTEDEANNYVTELEKTASGTITFEVVQENE